MKVFKILDCVVIAGMCVLFVVIVGMIAYLYVKEIKRKGRK